VSPGSPSDAFGVIVNQTTWLPMTQNWIFPQVDCLPANVIPHVICGETANLDQFAVDHLTVYGAMSWPARLRLLAGAAPALGTTLRGRTALIARVARQSGARVVHSHFGYTGYFCARAVRRLGLKHVVTFYGVDMSALPQTHPLWRERYRVLFEHVDQVLCEGPVMAASVGRLGCPAHKLRVHHLGVRLSDLPFRPRAWRPGEPLRVLIAASFREKKGIPYGIQALGRLRAHTPLEITIIGDADEDPRSLAEKARIRDVVATCGLASSVRFMGYQPRQNLLEEAYRHHVFLSPSVTASDGDTEGGAPIALIEMAATGMPVVSTRHADIPEVLGDGLLAPERDVEGLVACLQELIDAPASWERRAAVNRARIEREFDAAIQGKALAAIYAQLQNEQRVPPGAPRVDAH
jgi:colanic acid/amylovoran biosynthesis glycosyltransferase